MRLDLLGYGQVYGKVPARSTACNMELKERLFNCICGPLRINRKYVLLNFNSLLFLHLCLELQRVIESQTSVIFSFFRSVTM
jgi:hypothetical protein